MSPPDDGSRLASPDGAPSFRVVRGGTPTPEQHAAIARALAHLAADAEVAHAAGPPAWTRAALLEGATRVTVTSPQDLHR